jgi:hypothetical protein
MEIIDEVCTRFASVSSAEISRISHEEDAWKKCNGSPDPIPFEFAFGLRAM